MDHHLRLALRQIAGQHTPRIGRLPSSHRTPPRFPGQRYAGGTALDLAALFQSPALKWVEPEVPELLPKIIF